jgi:hypothetical protein
MSFKNRTSSPGADNDIEIPNSQTDIINPEDLMDKGANDSDVEIPNDQTDVINPEDLKDTGSDQAASDIPIDTPENPNNGPVPITHKPSRFAWKPPVD